MNVVLPLAAALSLSAALAAEEARWEPYPLEIDNERIDAELGRLHVPENRSKPDSPTIELAFIRLPADAGASGPPLIYLEGGPGEPGTAAARGAGASALAELRRFGDVILLDQRGTGMSQPSLLCGETWNLPLDRPAEPAELRPLMAAKLRACAERLRERGVDFRFYRTPENAEDIESVRIALDAERVTLWGISYGTHLALAYLRAHPDRVHRIVLTGVSGPDHAQTKLPSAVQAQLERLDGMFKENGIESDFLGLLRRTLDRLRREPVAVELRHPQTGETAVVTIGAFDVQWWLSNAVGRTWSLMGLPTELRALERGDFASAARFAYDVRTGAVGSMMGVAATIGAGVSPERAERIRREAESALLGAAVNFPFDAFSDMFEGLDVGDAGRAPIRSDAPILMISGTLDARTPPANAEELLPGLPNAAHLVVEGASHGYDLFYFHPVVRARIAAFLEGKPVASERIAGRFPFRAP